MKHPAPVRYIILCLWLVGLSQNRIAKSCNLSKAQVAGLIRTEGYENRAAMSDSERQALLDELQGIRFDEGPAPLDGGIMDRVGFRIRPLSRRQHRKAR